MSSAGSGDDTQQLRDLYTQLATALGNHDVAEENRLTCDKFQGRAQRRVDSYPMSTMDYFGSPEEFARSGVSAATDRLSAMLAPASKDAVQALVAAIIKQDGTQYTSALRRVRREGTTVTVNRIEVIEIDGDRATVDGSMTMRAFVQAPQVIEATNEAIREGGQWKDCTPSRQ